MLVDKFDYRRKMSIMQIIYIMLIYCVSVTTTTVVENCSILHTCIYNPYITYLYTAGDYMYLLN